MCRFKTIFLGIVLLICLFILSAETALSAETENKVLILGSWTDGRNSIIALLEENGEYVIIIDTNNDRLAVGYFDSETWDQFLDLLYNAVALYDNIEYGTLAKFGYSDSYFQIKKLKDGTVWIETAAIIEVPGSITWNIPTIYYDRHRNPTERIAIQAGVDILGNILKGNKVDIGGSLRRSIKNDTTMEGKIHSPKNELKTVGFSATAYTMRGFVDKISGQQRSLR